MKICKRSIIIMFAAALFAAQAAFGAVSDDAAEIRIDRADADARIILDVVGNIDGLVTQAEFTETFGPGRDVGNITTSYGNVEWAFPLASIDVPLKLAVGFNYGNASHWSLDLPFDNRGSVAKRYFIALCRGFERVTGHLSSATRIEHWRGDPCVNAYYPLREGTLLEISSTTEDSTGRISICEVPAVSSYRTNAVVRVDGAKMHAWPDDGATIRRVLHKDGLLLSLGEMQNSEKGGSSSAVWCRVQDGDGEVGWVRATELSIVGVNSIENAFAEWR